MDNNIKQEKEAQTPKTVFNNPSVKLGFPEPKKKWSYFIFKNSK